MKMILLTPRPFQSRQVSDTLSLASLCSITPRPYQSRQVSDTLASAQGLTDTALALQLEAGLPVVTPKAAVAVPPPLRHVAAPPVTPRQVRPSPTLNWWGM